MNLPDHAGIYIPNTRTYRIESATYAKQTRAADLRTHACREPQALLSIAAAEILLATALTTWLVWQPRRANLPSVRRATGRLHPCDIRFAGPVARSRLQLVPPKNHPFAMILLGATFMTSTVAARTAIAILLGGRDNHVHSRPSAVRIRLCAIPGHDRAVSRQSHSPCAHHRFHGTLADFQWRAAAGLVRGGSGDRLPWPPLVRTADACGRRVDSQLTQVRLGRAL